MYKVDKISSLCIPVTEKDLISEREKEQYFGVSCRSDICSGVQVIATGSNRTSVAEYETMKKAIYHLQNNFITGLQ